MVRKTEQAAKSKVASNLERKTENTSEHAPTSHRAYWVRKS